jgi:hypothetical protein
MIMTTNNNKKWRWVALAGAACVLSWIALGIGIAMEAGFGVMVVLATLAAVTTEGTFWLAALVLGVSTYQARRQIWQALRKKLSLG